MLKNPTPYQIAIQAAIRLAAIFLVVLFALSWFFFAQSFSVATVIVVACLATLGLALSAYLLFIHYLKKYILRKIKVIYKSIHSRKLSPEEKIRTTKMNIRTNIIEQVERQVEEWAQDYEKKLAQFKSWADYRRKYIGDISHELKTPIFNVQGFIHTLLEGAMYDESVNELFLRKAAANVDRLQTIVEDLESISRLESGQLILDIQTFDIKELVTEVFEGMEFKAKEKDISLIFKDGASKNYRVKADKEYIRQVLNNLVHNSIKYGNPKGLTKVGFYDMDPNILIEVADNGIGIPKKHINHVFDRFYRVDKSRSRVQGGSGLGLSIVKHIMEAHQQTINVRSTLNLGSTFGFTLEKVS